MKKLFLALSIGFLYLNASSQTKIGIRFSPSYNNVAVSSSSDTLTILNNDEYIRFLFGPFLDLYLTENYYFQTGIIYAPKRFNLQYQSPNSSDNSVYDLNYLQVPLALKLFTDEFALDQRIYFLLGGQAEFLVNDVQIEPQQLVNSFNFFDLSYYLGAGWEYRIGLNTHILVGFSFSGGLLNLVNDYGELDGELETRSRLYSLDLGIKF